MSIKQTDSHKGDILVVDDDLPSLNTLSSMLTMEGYEVRGVPDGQMALTVIENRPPELILLDIKMPGMDGFDVCRKIKADEHSSGIPILFLSALDEATDKLKGFEAGAVDFITKPFEVEEVLARVDTHLTLSRLRRNLEQLVENRTADLKESEERYRSIVETSPVSIMAVRHRCFLFVNPAGARMMGFSDPEKMVGIPVMEVIEPESQHLVMTRIERLESGKNNPLTEITLIKQDGMRITVESISVSIPLDGIPTALIISQDISDRKQKEEEIRNASEKIEKQMLFDNLLSRLSTEYINLPFERIDERINEGLEQVAENIGIERIALLQFSDDKQKLELTHTYSIDPRHRAPIFLVSEKHPWLTESLRRGITLQISSIDEMPEEAVAEKQYVRDQGFKSFVAIPMKVAESVIGAISYSSMTSEHAFSDELVQRLTLVSDIFANVFDRKFKEQNLRDAYTNIEQMKQRLENENLYLRQEIEVTHRHDEIVGKSQAIKQVLSQAEAVSRQDTSVLILGETGTGKELVAYAIHRMSPRKNRAMMKVNCAALPSLLIESEMFGREKGAFTGALTQQVGRFEAANGSTIFLDEIGDLPMDMQVKLLRVLQEGQFERLGSPKTITVDVRVIAATNRDLHKAVREGAFRRDLFYRLNVFPITVPPLRDRREDIPLLLWSFVREYEEAMGKKIDRMTNQTIDLMQAYSWPGNVRELKNVIERAMILNTDPVLHIDHLESDETIDRPVTLEDANRHHILKVLKNTGWRVGGKNGAAEILGLKRSTLQTKMKSLNIQRPKD
jgi:PAS domain S-box-containing protein